MPFVSVSPICPCTLGGGGGGGGGAKVIGSSGLLLLVSSDLVYFISFRDLKSPCR